MEARSEWVWTVIIAKAVVVCLLIFVFFILSLATMFGGAIPDFRMATEATFLGRP